MPRAARILPEVGVFHVLTRGNNKQDVFHDNGDFRSYVKLLKEYKSRYPFYLYHFVLIYGSDRFIADTERKYGVEKFPAKRGRPRGVSFATPQGRTKKI